MASRSLFPRLVAALLCVGAGAVVPALAEDWKPIDPAHLAMKASTVEKDADAEAIFWEVRVNDEDFDTVLNHYIRIKVFTERGKESQSTIDIQYVGATTIRDIAGRTVKPDGSIVELKKDAIFDRTIVKLGGIKVKAKSFAMPAVEPGSIVEYRWRESRRSAYYMRFQVQRDIPVQVVTYYIKPGQYVSLGMKMMTFNCSAPMSKQRDGFYSTTYTNIPGFREEPRMPPEDQVRAWMLIYYSQGSAIDPQKFWKEYGKKKIRRVQG